MKNQLLVILVSSLIGIPVAFLFASNWTRNFAYQYPIGIEFVVLPVFGAMLVLAIAIGQQAISSINARITEVIKEV